jgi:F420-dependent oxidoreductase-like protein
LIEVAIMIEGQDGLTWPRWQRIAQAVEELGFAGLYRSDHYTNNAPPDKDSLELWVSLTWLASHTSRIEFGSMVSPMSFRHPTMTARMASAVDDLSGGRLTLGLGAGWQEREHTHYGWDLLALPERFDRFEEGLEVTTRLFNSATPVDFSGHYYHLKEASLLPRPARPGGPPILIGGNGPKRTLPLVAAYAGVWNANTIPPAEVARLNGELDQLLQQKGRSPAAVKRTLTTNIVFGKDPATLEKKLQKMDGEAVRLKERGLIVGTGPEVVEQLGRLQEARVERVMLQWLDMDDLDGLENLAKAVLK